MNFTEMMVAAVLTTGVAGAAYTAVDMDALTAQAERTAAEATCKAVDTGVAAYVEANGDAPATITQIGEYVRGDITAYRLDNGVAVGPGCPGQPG